MVDITQIRWWTQHFERLPRIGSTYSRKAGAHPQQLPYGQVSYRTCKISAWITRRGYCRLELFPGLVFQESESIHRCGATHDSYTR